ncbi:ExeA family protein [Paraferrimonas haliotis]|uniref:ExeA family protein n=1 Tax=Paraferrimonas haliotis TaxID=2013866 RepID=UPI000BA9AD7C|nr:ExeA family protein [Paraferrimonas haliotis]
MYQAFYGLSEGPFSIAPNPKYLFQSARHRDALTHLTYGLGETGGFVLLTGEVGTGKTTVSRTLLQQLPENTDTAFILNPSLTELELLATLCDELGIKYPQQPSLKQLTDCISEFLSSNHQAGRNTVLIIDEAQHLRAEVLEQLRLLTNLETDTKKLLQVILIGQPELQQLLRRKELRQLAQRITARYHLMPLTEKEVASYVGHRLQVGGRAQPLFDAGAIKALHKASSGVPRLINLIAERSLLAGFANQLAVIDKKTVAAAAVEVLGVEEPAETSSQSWVPWAISGVLLVLLITSFLWRHGDLFLPEEHQQNRFPKKQVVSPQPQLPAATQPPQQTSLTTPSEPDLTAIIEQAEDIDLSFAALFDLWQQPLYKGLTPCQSAKRNGLSCYQQQGNFRTIARIDYPAVVYMQQQNQRFYAALIAVDGEQLLLQLAEQRIWVSQAWFDQRFSGTFEILWVKPAMPLQAIGPGSQGKQVQWLEDSLARVAGTTPKLRQQFDQELANQVETFQLDNGLIVDGIAGRETLIHLNLRVSNTGPRLGTL